jgi:hypothetical protein
VCSHLEKDGVEDAVTEKKFFSPRADHQGHTHVDDEQKEGRFGMDPKTYPEWQANLLKCLVSTTKAASAVGSHDISFERSIDTDFDKSLTIVTDRILNLSNRLLKFAGLRGDNYEDEDDLEDRWHEVVDIVDGLLERAVKHITFLEQI